MNWDLTSGHAQSAAQFAQSASQNLHCRPRR